MAPSKQFKSKLKIDALQEGKFLNIREMNVQSKFKVSTVLPYVYPVKITKKGTITIFMTV